ncbi:MAG: [protein-PII] uridylyltransferase [Acidimicrobiales bacterium]
MGLERAPLLADETLAGAAWCSAHTALVDAWLRSLFETAAGSTSGLALVALGGYGRAELCPESDIDVMLVRARDTDATAVADRIWYPIWDQGIHLGHSVSTVRQALDLASGDLDTATALLSVRHVAGDRRLSDELAEVASEQWRRKSKRWLTELGERVVLRQEKTGEVAFTLEPDLKEGRGGMRDAHALAWAEAAQRTLLDHDELNLAAAYSTLLGARVELQRHTGRPSNLLVLEEQDAVAAALGDADADVLMARIAEAARAIAWTSDDTWRRIRSALRGPLGRISRRTRTLGPDIQLRDGEVHVTAWSDDPTLLLRVAVAAARNGANIERDTLEQLATTAAPLADPWPAEAREAFVELLRTGRSAVRVIEALDQRCVWATVLPEWQPVRARPQRNAYHRYTVDRHLLEATANAARLAGNVDRPDLLVTAALLHDIGKGYGGDHTERGTVLARDIATRMGYPLPDVDAIAGLVEQHLLLSEVATRRDLDDPTTIRRVADAVGSVERLNLLAALTEADSRATGSSAWGPWKAELVGRLVERVAHVLEGGQLGQVVDEQFPAAGELALVGTTGQHIDVQADVVTVAADDRPGLFGRVAGVLALHGLDVVSAAAYSTETGRALSRFRVQDRFRSETPWDRVTSDLELALAGRLALHARLAERTQTYGARRGRIQPASWVHIDNDASTDATVIDVHTEDGVGVLYRITRALAELDLDIRSAKVETLGSSVVDAFYVRDSTRSKVTDTHTLREIERAILHSLAG